MNEAAMKYLLSITGPLTLGGVDILEENDDMGATFVVIPNEDAEYGALIGKGGEHADAIRTMMRAWSGTNTDAKLRINVMVPNPKRIKTQFTS